MPERTPSWRPSALQRVLRKRSLYWAAALALALTTYLVVGSLLADARSSKAEYGVTRPVLVTTTAVGRGHTLADDTALVDLPTIVLPDDALAELGEDVIAAAAMAANTVVTRSNTVTTSNTGSDAHPSGVVLALPITPLTPNVAPGTPVLLVANLDPFAGIEPRIFEATVVSAEDGQLQIALNREDLIPAAAAVQAGVVTVALAG